VRAEPDEAEGGLDDKAADHAVERHAETHVDLLEPVGTRHGVVTSKGPDAAGSGGGASSTAEDAEKDEWDREDERANFATDCRTQDDGDGLSVGVVEEGVDIREDKGQGNEENESDDKVHDGGAEHCLGDLRRGRLDFLGHGDDHSGGRVGVRCVKDTNNPRPARSPSRVRLERGEDISSAVATLFGDCQDCADESNDANESEVHGGSLLLLVSTKNNTTSRPVHIRREAAATCFRVQRSSSPGL